MNEFQQRGERGERGERNERGGRREKKKLFVKKKICRFCSDQHLHISYKEPLLLRGFTTERGKIIPRRISGNCASHQRILTTAIKRARAIALLPFTAASMIADAA